MNVEIGTGAAQFPEKEDTNEIFVAVHERTNNLIDVVNQVLSPGDVAFTLGSGNDTTVVLNSSDWDSDNICMSVTSLVGGLVMLLGTVFSCFFLNFTVVIPHWERDVVLYGGLSVILVAVAHRSTT